MKRRIFTAGLSFVAIRSDRVIRVQSDQFFLVLLDHIEKLIEEV